MRPTRALPCEDGGHLVSSPPQSPPPCSYYAANTGQAPLPSPSSDKPRAHFTPANIRSYLDNTEPIYQNEKFYELITPQKFVKPSHNTSIKSSDSFNKIPQPLRSVPAVPSSPDVKPKSGKPADVPTSSADVKEEKKKKWSLGGLFRRRRKKASETESSSAEEDTKLGFLARRRSRREKRKQRGKKTEAADATSNLLRVDQATSQDSLPGSRDRSSARHVDSSGGSGSVDGSCRRDRRLAAMQRSAAAHTNPSSSDEDDSRKTGSLSLNRSGSLSRRSRYARTERYIKRLSRDEETVLQREATALQHRHDQSDGDARCYVTSATPSPGQSPLIRHKNPLRLLSSSVPHATASNPASLERRSHQRTQRRDGHSPLPPSCDPRRQSNYESFRSPGQRSLSYDNNIHRVPTSPQDNVICVQFPVARISHFVGPGSVRPGSTLKLGPPPPPPRDPHRRVTPLSPSRPMSYAFEDGAAPVRRSQNGSYLSLDNQAATYNNHNGPITGDSRSNSENPIASAFVRPASTTLVETLSGRRNAPQFQYYADQSPRSRRPIHIQQVSEKNPVSQVTAFWKQRELDTSGRNLAMRLAVDVAPSSGSSVDNVSLRSPSVDESEQRQLSMVLETQEQRLNNSQQAQELTPKMKYLLDCLPSDGEPAAQSGTLNNGIFKARPVVSDVTSTARSDTPRSVVKTNSGQESCSKVAPKARPTFSSPKPRFTFHEPAITSKDFGQPLTVKPRSVPPTPPVRRYSRQLSSSSLEAEDETQALFTRTVANLQDGGQTPVRTSTNLQDGGQTPVRTSTNLQDGRQTPVRTAANLERDKQTPVRTAANLERDKQTPVRTAANLEDALDELEAIYKSLQLGDEDLLDRAERRDLPTKFQLREPLPALLAGSVSDSGYELIPARKRAPSSRRSGIPDRVADDMAYRRLHPKDRPDSQNIVSQAGSFLLTSPTIQAAAEEHFKTSEPDVTYDDVVYRNIRHVNNALKVVEPQLPFGIPVGPITPAANSDYLHATPSERYRPTFKPRRTPDVVGDDLAYRALRKEGATRDGTLFQGAKLDDTKKKEGATRDGTLFHGAKLDDSKKKEEATRDGTLFYGTKLDNTKKKEGATRDGTLFHGAKLDNTKKKEGATRDGTLFHGAKLDNTKKKEGATGDGTLFHGAKLVDDKRKAGAPRDISLAVDTALHNARLNDTNFSLRKRRAVRSLSANLPSLIGCDRNKMSVATNVASEKAQSLTHLPDALEIAQKILEGKEVIGGGPNNAMWNVPGTLRAGDRNSTTSTETLTDSRANLATLLDKRNSWQQRVRVNGAPPLAGLVDTNRDVRDRCRDTTEEQNVSNADSPLNGTQIEDLLSALARDCRSTSEQLGMQLAGFSTNGQLADFSPSGQLTGFDTSEQLIAFNTSEQLTNCNTSKQLRGFNTSDLVDLQLADLRSEQVCSNTSQQLTLDKLSDDVISDDSLDVKAESVAESADSDEPMTALEDLHIYEPQDVAKTSEAELDAELEALTGEDEEIQAIFRAEDLRNNNDACGVEASPPAAKPRGKDGATSAVMTGEASLVLLASTYCTQHALAQDWLTVIAICIAVVALLAFLML